MAISKETKKQLTAVAVCIGIAVIYYGLMIVSGFITDLLHITSPAPYMAFKELLYALSALGLMKLLGIKISSAVFNPLNKYGKQILAFISALIIIKSAFAFSGPPTRSIYEIILFSLTMLLVGIAEEGVFRGIIAESMVRVFGRNKKGRIKAALISGAIFGAIHIINAASADLSGVLIQCTGAFVMGVYFAGIYYCTGCLALNIFIHAAIDWSNLIRFSFYAEGSVQATISGYSPLMLIPIAISLAVCLCMDAMWTASPIKKHQNHKISTLRTTG